MRKPVVVYPPEVAAQLEELDPAFQGAVAEVGLGEDADDWYVREIRQVMTVYRIANSRSEAVVSAVEPPMDAERADRVLMPIAKKRQ